MQNFVRDDGATHTLHLRDFRDIYPRFPRIQVQRLITPHNIVLLLTNWYVSVFRKAK